MNTETFNLKFSKVNGIINMLKDELLAISLSIYSSQSLVISVIGLTADLLTCYWDFSSVKG